MCEYEIGEGVNGGCAHEVGEGVSGVCMCACVGQLSVTKTQFAMSC